MAQLIAAQQVLENTWTEQPLEEEGNAGAFVAPSSPTLYPLAFWRAHRESIIASAQAGALPLGLLLQPDDAVEEIAADLPHLALIAINFPKFVDGRGYSSAALLRQRYGYRGELRAVGDVLHDQLFYLRRVGFDSYALKDGKSTAYAIAHGFTTFTEPYQASTDQPLPHFRRQP